MIRPALPFVAILLAAAAPPSVVPVQPGRWQYSVTILDAQMPGAPQVATMMRGHVTNTSYCLSPADAAAGPRGVVERSGGRCRFTSFNQVGPHVTGTMVCDRGMTITSSGTYTPTAIDVAGRMTGPNGMRMTTRTTGRRTGAC